MGLYNILRKGDAHKIITLYFWGLLIGIVVPHEFAIVIHVTT